MNTENLIIELGTEELPPKALRNLSQSFAHTIEQQLTNLDVGFSSVKALASPRRLAVRIENCTEKQPDKVVEKRGPAIQAAFDESGAPTKAAQGWAKGNGIDISHAGRLKTDKGEWLMHEAEVAGQRIHDLIQSIVDTALSSLPIPKPMRWGSSEAQFIRPVHTVCALFGSEILPLVLFDLNASNRISGHRFHGQASVELSHADQYESVLEQEYVLVDYEKRMDRIEQQLLSIADNLGLKADYTPALLEEISSLVEWPVVLTAHFEERFLDVPKEALIYTMKDDQKYVPLLKSDGELSATFLFVSNIESRDPQQVIDGNQKVIRPRLSDAMFFFDTDKKTSLEQKAAKLNTVLFQKELGTVAEKTDRLQYIAQQVAALINVDPIPCTRAALLSKADLLTNMVMEFPSVQGVMGRHYAIADGESNDVALALEEQYLPRFAGDTLPQSTVGSVLSIADKLDTLVGIFGVGKLPKGDKDPFALRRSAIGLLRILVENKMNLSIERLVDISIVAYANKLSNKETKQQVIDFIFDRFKPYFGDLGIPADVVISVQSQKPITAIDFDARVKAVNAFKLSPNSVSLIASNKRVSNILNKNNVIPSAPINIVKDKLVEQEEIALFELVGTLEQQCAPLIAERDYQRVLQLLLTLDQPLAEFFDNVMVMAEDDVIKNNRISLLVSVRALFLSVADVSVLSV